MSSYGVKVKIAFDDGPMVVSPTWTDIVPLSGCNIAEITVDRGRPSETAKTDTGQATVTGFDFDGLFDPTNTTSTYAGKILPRKQAMIELRDPVLDLWYPIFRGHVADWNYELEITRQMLRFELQLVDGFAFLAAAEMLPGLGWGQTLPTTVAAGNIYYGGLAPNYDVDQVDDRLKDILADAGWPSGLYEIFTGNVAVNNTVYPAGTQALSALFDAADAEFPGAANLYCSKSGVLTFHGRYARFNPDVALYNINERNVGDPSLTDGDATACPVAELAFTEGTESIINSCLAYPDSIDTETFNYAAQIVLDQTSIDAYGLNSFPLENLQTYYDIANGLNATDATKLFATYYVDNFKDPRPRVNRMVFKTKGTSDRLAAPLWRQLCRCEISDLLNLTTAHPGGGGFAAEAFFVEGLHYVIRPLNENVVDVTLTCDVSPQAYYTENPFSLRAYARATAQPGAVVIT